MQAQPQVMSYIVAGAVMALVFTLRLRRVGRQRRLRIERLWIVPAIFLVLTVFALIEAPLSLAAAALSVIALVVGSAIGWQRGRLMRIHVDPETHELSQASSVAAVLFIVAILVVRRATAVLAETNALPVHLDPRPASAVLLCFALGMLSVTRLEMYLRARRLLDEARASVFG